MRRLQIYIPLGREIHRRRICLLTLNKADAHDVSLHVFEEEPDALETTSISRPPTRTGDATWKLVTFVSVRHASCEL